jgi:hypothetical protein
LLGILCSSLQNLEEVDLSLLVEKTMMKWKLNRGIASIAISIVPVMRPIAQSYECVMLHRAYTQPNSISQPRIFDEAPNEKTFFQIRTLKSVSFLSLHEMVLGSRRVVSVSSQPT